MGRTTLTTVTVGLLLLAGCSTSPDPGTQPSATPVPSATQTQGPTPSPSQTATVSASPAPAATASCTSFGSTRTASSTDPQAMSTLTGAAMRVGRHNCFERFVFELQGSGTRPGWTVGYVRQLNGQGSGEPVPLRGNADLEVVLGVWTVTDFEGRPDEWPPFTGADTIVTRGFVALKEARNLFAYEGTTQIGLGVDKRRPFRVTWVADPQRLVVDVYTGRPAG